MDIVHDLEKLPLPVEKDGYDLIYSKFCLEHISWRIIPDFIKDLYRILKPGGRVYIITSNLRVQCEMLSSKKTWTLKDDVCMVFGDLNYNENSHRGSLSPELAEELFKAAGFVDFIWSSLPEWRGDVVYEARKVFV